MAQITFIFHIPHHKFLYICVPDYEFSPVYAHMCLCMDPELIFSKHETNIFKDFFLKIFFKYFV